MACRASSGAVILDASFEALEVRTCHARSRVGTALARSAWSPGARRSRSQVPVDSGLVATDICDKRHQAWNPADVQSLPRTARGPDVP